MNAKSVLKNVIGEERLSSVKGEVFHYACSVNLFLHHKSKLEYDNKYLNVQSVLSEEGYHVYRGYYDLDYLNQDGKKFLCHRLPINAENNRKTKCEIGYYQLDKGMFEKIADTSAWCWQQGSRLRWIDCDHLIFNDVDGEHYCSKIYDVRTGQQCKIIDWPLYDITPDFQYGLTLNFSRLQRLRPGYGYDYFPDKTIDDRAPSNDGIVLVNLETGASEVLYSLSELAQMVDDGGAYTHYVNHISVSPDGQHFIFFHIFFKPGNNGWKTVLYVSDIHGKKLYALEKRDRSSHYCWIDNTHIMMTCRKENRQEYYAIFNIEDGSKTILKTTNLDVDGHPRKSINESSFITDTYPLKNSLQKIRSFHIDDKYAETMVSVYHDYRLRGEKRCDLHPSVSLDYKILSVDSTFQKNRRSIILFNFVREKGDRINL